jgi:hypothetical protein
MCPFLAYLSQFCLDSFIRPEISFKKHILDMPASHIWLALLYWRPNASHCVACEKDTLHGHSSQCGLRKITISGQKSQSLI